MSIIKRFILIFTLINSFSQLVPHKALTPQERSLVHAYCMDLAQRAGWPQATFKLDDDLTYDTRKVYGYYNKLKNYISLSPTAQQRILETQNSENYFGFWSKKQEEKITYETETVLHELGHSESMSVVRALLMVWTGDYALRSLMRQKYSLLAYVPLIACSVKLNSIFEEAYADRFATEKMCNIFGFERTRRYLNNEDRRDESLTDYFAGYQSKNSLLRYVDKLEKWSKREPIQSSFYVNNAI